MLKLHFEKIYSTDRIDEPTYIGIPYAKGTLKNIDCVAVKDIEGNVVPSQAKCTAKWEDGSVKWLFVRFNATIPANKSAVYYLDTDLGAEKFESIYVDKAEVDTGKVKFRLSTEENMLFEAVEYGGNKYGSDYISAPKLIDDKNNEYKLKMEHWVTIERGAVCAVLKGTGDFCFGENKVGVEIMLTAYNNKPYFELAPRLINTTDSELVIKEYSIRNKIVPSGETRLATGISNYKTKYNISENGEGVYTGIDANYLKYEANEHNAEVFYGTFFADYTDENGGLAVSIHQAQQNFPKAFGVDKDGISAYIVPNEGNVVMQSGAAREQKMLFYFHGKDEELKYISNITTIYQMPDRPAVETSVFEKAGVFESVFTEKKNRKIEMYLVGKADEHSRCYGMMNWGDSPDVGYTSQGRGGGKLVWTNNEYDFPHAAMLMYARTGIRRYMDYVLVAARHQMDVDVCHYSKNPLIMGGQYEHTNGHSVNGKIVCSHQWVEGLFDYYHLTGDRTAYDTAIGMGENILRLLETPDFQKTGQMNARETGWAMRSLVALYRETNDEKWLEKCDWIVGHFEEWESEYGLWLSTYMDNVAIRVVFMIAVAVGSLMRYHRIRPQQKIKDMILRAVDDLCENCILDNGLFYYKELPSLKRLGNNPIILEALAIAYELTGDKKYLEKGIPTLEYIQSYAAARLQMGKNITEDTLLCGGIGSKSFAQLMIPVSTFYTACMKEDIL